MQSGMLAGLRRARFTLSYAVVVSTITAAMVRMDPAMHDALIRHASTNLHNLSRGRFGTLISSAFVVDAGPIYLWLPGLVCLLLVAELTLGGGRTALTFATGHIGATLLVAAGLVAAVKLNWLSPSISRASDVGMSYGAMAVVGVLTATLPARWRAAWIGFWCAAAVVVVTGGAGFTDIGHAVALVLGMVVSIRFGARAHWSVPTVLLLCVGAAFAFLVLADGLLGVLEGAVWGTVGALAASAVERLRRTQTNSSADAVTQSERQDCGGSSSSSPGVSHS
ncbi:MAG: rhomboid-like protein [Actinomycetota bacterium]